MSVLVELMIAVKSFMLLHVGLATWFHSSVLLVGQSLTLDILVIAFTEYNELTSFVCE